MPLPLPNLDTRRWADLVAEGRALIPRYAPTWNDHNISDPGITIIELLAWLTEQSIYRVNQIPARHRQKFLALLGFAPDPPQAALTVLSFSPTSGNRLNLPKGTCLDTQSDRGQSVPFQTLSDLTAIPLQLLTLQVDDGSGIQDLSRVWQEGSPFYPFGTAAQVAERTHRVQLGETIASLSQRYESSPEAIAQLNDLPSTTAPLHPRQRLIIPGSTAFYLGFAEPLPTNQSINLWVQLQGAGTSQETRRNLQDQILQDQTSINHSLSLQHHSVRTVWEFYADINGGQWQELLTTANELVDETRSLTLSGMVQWMLPGIMQVRSLGNVMEPRYYLRCRLETGQYDAAPVCAKVVVNAIAAVQAQPMPVSSNPSETSLLLGMSNGLPLQEFQLPTVQVQENTLNLQVQRANTIETDWQLRPDLDASRRTDRHFTLNPTTGRIGFGDGERGSIPAEGSAIRVQYATTQGNAGNIAAQMSWQLKIVPDQSVESISENLESIRNPFPAVGGRDAESFANAAGRAAAALWCHERLLDLSEQFQTETLDQLDRALVLSRKAPLRATTLLDFERLVLEVPGTQIARTRAWSGIDVNYPGLQAPGTVTVIVLPYLPQGRPQPSPGLLDAVYRYLDRRRVICTRLVVVGPQYLEVRVQAQVRLKAGVRAERVQPDILAALNRFLDPLQGGAAQRGYPFGRDVYRSEILQVIDEVPGVDYVAALELISGNGIAQCGNLCVPPHWLVVAGQHAIVIS
ncbi:MAG: baseplate J/gp47 family protein [Elainella sp. Prado103]|nr:baseplate J/gp47 family protein [Elainella sp. Prado103]